MLIRSKNTELIVDISYSLTIQYLTCLLIFFHFKQETHKISDEILLKAHYKDVPNVLIPNLYYY